MSTNQGFRSKSKARNRFRGVLDASEAIRYPLLAVGVDVERYRFWGFLGARRAPRNCFESPYDRTLDNVMAW